jgi:predicted ribosomally synthesized peptide with nif11-like leader
MSKESVGKFLASLHEDASLEKGLVAAQAAAIVEYAAKHGFDFTVDELAQITEALLKTGDAEPANGELSDEELEDVAGGLTTTLSRGRNYLRAGGAGMVSIVRGPSANSLMGTGS